MKMKRWTIVVMAAAFAVGITQAQSSGTWTNKAAGTFDWGSSGNWSGDTIAYGADNTATFSSSLTAAQVVNLEAARTIGNIINSSSTFDRTISGANTLTLDCTSGTPTIDVTTSGRILTISALIAGSKGLQKTGAGALILNGTNNTYSGTTTLTAGTLQGYVSSSSLTPVSPFGTSSLAFNGGILQLRAIGSGGSTTETITLGNNVTVGGNVAINATRHGASAVNKTIAMGTLSIGANTLSVDGGNQYLLSFGATTLTGNAIFNPNGASATILVLGSISDGGNSYGITKSGSNTLRLTGTNTYAGTTKISGGVLEVQGSIASSSAITNNATLTFNSGSAQSYSNVISGSGSLTKSGAGTLTLSGDNTFTGSVTINGGTLFLLGLNQYTGTTTIGGTAGGTLMINTLKNYSVASSLGAPTSGDIIFNRTTVGNLIYVGSGDTVNRTIRLEDDVSNRNNNSGIYNNGTGALIFNGSTFNTPFVSSGNAGHTTTLILGGTFTGSANEIRGVIADNQFSTSSRFAITKNGIGTWMLSGSNTFTGATTLSGGGTLVLDYSSQNNSKLSDTATLVLANGYGDITLRGGSHVETNGALAISSGGGHTSIARDGGSATLAFGVISRGQSNGGTMSLAEDNLATTSSPVFNGILGGGITVGSNWAKVSSGNIVALTSSDYTDLTATVPASLSGSVNYQVTGSVSRAVGNINSLRIVGGGDDQVLTISSGNLAPSTVTGVGTLANSGGILYAGGGNNNYTITGAGNIQAQNANQELIINTYTGTLTVDMALTMGSSILTKTGAGTLIHTKAGTYTGATYVNQGALQLRHAAAAGTTANGIIVANKAALELANSITVGAEALTITGTGVSSGGALRNVSSNTSTYGGVITIGNGGARINSDASGILTLTSNLVTSAFNDATIGGSGNTTVSGVISGAGNLIKDGSGTLTLSGTNTYTGETIINGGKLALGGHNVLNGKSITLNSGTLDAGTYINTLSTLKVSGSGSIVMSPGAVLAFADSSAIQWSGTLNLSGVFAAGTSLRFGTSSAGLTSDQIALLKVTGYTLSLDANGYLTGKPSGTIISFQ